MKLIQIGKFLSDAGKLTAVIAGFHAASRGAYDVGCFYLLIVVLAEVWWRDR